MEENIIQINGRIMTNVNASVKKRHLCEKDYVWNPAICSCENGKYLARIKDYSAVTCNKIIESYNEKTKTILTNFNKKYDLKNTKFLYFTCIFINCYKISDSC